VGGRAASLVSAASVATAAENDCPHLALLGAGWQPDTQRRGRGIAIGRQAAAFGDIVAALPPPATSRGPSAAGNAVFKSGARVVKVLR